MKWVWIAYPLLALVGIIGVTGYLTGPGQEYLHNIQARKERAEQTEKMLNLLNRKLTILGQADESKLQSDLQILLSAMPAKRDIWGIMAELNQAASGSGAKLVNYSGNVGDVKEASEGAKVAATAKNENGPVIITAEYKIKDFKDLTMILKKLHQSLPLIRVTEVDLKGETAKIVLEGAWKAWEKVAALADQDLPAGYTKIVESIKSEVGEYDNWNSEMLDKNFNFVENPF